MVSKKNISLLVVSLLSLSVALGQRMNGITIIGNTLGSKTLSEQQVVDAFRAKNTFWPNGKTLLVCLPETQSADAVEVSKKIYGKTVSEVQKFWLSQVFQGRSRAPFFFESDQELINFVAKTPGAIGAFVNDKNAPVPNELMLLITP